MASREELLNQLEIYMERREVFPMWDVADEMLNLERFLVPKPNFIQDIEYYSLFKPTDGKFVSLFVGKSVMNYPMAATGHLARIVAKEYDLEFRQPIVVNNCKWFYKMACLLSLNEMGVDDGSEESALFRRIFGDSGFMNIYPSFSAVQAVAAASEKRLDPKIVKQIVGDNTLAHQFSEAIDGGFDFIHFYNPGPEGDLDEKVITIFGLAQLLKQNGIMIMQYLDSYYGDSIAVKERLMRRGIRPMLEGYPFSSIHFLDSLDVYKKPENTQKSSA